MTMEPRRRSARLANKPPPNFHDLFNAPKIPSSQSLRSKTNSKSQINRSRGQERQEKPSSPRKRTSLNRIQTRVSYNGDSQNNSFASRHRAIEREPTSTPNHGWFTRNVQDFTRNAQDRHDMSTSSHGSEVASDRVSTETTRATGREAGTILAAIRAAFKQNRRPSWNSDDSADTTPAEPGSGISDLDKNLAVIICRNALFVTGATYFFIAMASLQILYSLGRWIAQQVKDNMNNSVSEAEPRDTLDTISTDTSDHNRIADAVNLISEKKDEILDSAKQKGRDQLEKIKEELRKSISADDAATDEEELIPQTVQGAGAVNNGKPVTKNRDPEPLERDDLETEMETIRTYHGSRSRSSRHTALPGDTEVLVARDRALSRSPTPNCEEDSARDCETIRTYRQRETVDSITRPKERNESIDQPTLEARRLGGRERNEGSGVSLRRRSSPVAENNAQDESKPIQPISEGTEQNAYPESRHETNVEDQETIETKLSLISADPRETIPLELLEDRQKIAEDQSRVRVGSGPIQNQKPIVRSSVDDTNVADHETIRTRHSQRPEDEIEAGSVTTESSTQVHDEETIKTAPMNERRINMFPKAKNAIDTIVEDQETTATAINTTDDERERQMFLATMSELSEELQKEEKESEEKENEDKSIDELERTFNAMYKQEPSAQLEEIPEKSITQDEGLRVPSSPENLIPSITCLQPGDKIAYSMIRESQHCNEECKFLKSDDYSLERKIRRDNDDAVTITGSDEDTREFIHGIQRNIRPDGIREKLKFFESMVSMNNRHSEQLDSFERETNELESLQKTTSGFMEIRQKSEELEQLVAQAIKGVESLSRIGTDSVKDEQTAEVIEEHAQAEKTSLFQMSQEIRANLTPEYYDDRIELDDSGAISVANHHPQHNTGIVINREDNPGYDEEIHESGAFSRLAVVSEQIQETSDQLLQFKEVTRKLRRAKQATSTSQVTELDMQETTTIITRQSDFMKEELSPNRSHTEDLPIQLSVATNNKIKMERTHSMPMFNKEDEAIRCTVEIMPLMRNSVTNDRTKSPEAHESDDQVSSRTHTQFSHVRELEENDSEIECLVLDSPDDLPQPNIMMHESLATKMTRFNTMDMHTAEEISISLFNDEASFRTAFQNSNEFLSVRSLDSSQGFQLDTSSGKSKECYDSIEDFDCTRRLTGKSKVHTAIKELEERINRKVVSKNDVDQGNPSVCELITKFEKCTEEDEPPVVCGVVSDRPVNGQYDYCEDGPPLLASLTRTHAP